MISNFDKENNTNEEPTETRSHISVLGKAVKEGNAIEYQELKNIFLDVAVVWAQVSSVQARYPLPAATSSAPRCVAFVVRRGFVEEADDDVFQRLGFAVEAVFVKVSYRAPCLFE